MALMVPGFWQRGGIKISRARQSIRAESQPDRQRSRANDLPCSSQPVIAWGRVDNVQDRRRREGQIRQILSQNLDRFSGGRSFFEGGSKSGFDMLRLRRVLARRHLHATATGDRRSSGRTTEANPMQGSVSWGESHTSDPAVTSTVPRGSTRVSEIAHSLHTHKKSTRDQSHKCFLNIGRGDRIRTYDLMTPSHAR